MWKGFKDCLGALDGTHIKIRVPTVDKPRYRTQKGDMTTSMLGVYTPDMHFVYVLPGWEGSVSDGRVLRDAISRRHRLKVPHVMPGFSQSNVSPQSSRRTKRKWVSEEEVALVASMFYLQNVGTFNADTGSM
ncbi:protein ALP1-like [Gossypium arboreum]|uniref:protein ALP1-like n=1 Tax=Gossypium arboreum TaxID=29729 RepID=UPI0008196E90|nr:protein ALP1-like [Gossypium arboreum]